MFQRGSKQNIFFFVGFTLMLSVAAVWGIWQGSSKIESVAAFGMEGAKDGQTQILLQQDGSRVQGSGVELFGNRIEITSGGIYRIAGTLKEGQIHVAAGEAETVTLVLAGVEVTNASEAAVKIESTGQTELLLEEGTENQIQSGEVQDITPEEDGASEPSGSKGAIYADGDLNIQGTGSLTVSGYINNGIHTTGNLVIDGGTIRVEAVNHGIKGKASVTVRDGDLTILAGNDGIKSDNDTSEEYGWISLEGGNIRIESQGDAVQAETALEIKGGTYQVVTGGGSENASETLKKEENPPGFAGGEMPEVSEEPLEFGGESPKLGKEAPEFGKEPPEFEEGASLDMESDPHRFEQRPGGQGEQPDKGDNNTTPGGEPFNQEGGKRFQEGMKPDGQAEEEEEEDQSVSTKGFKCKTQMNISGGSFSADTQDDAFHSDGSIRITGGNFVIASGDDGIHANQELAIEGGSIQIDKSYEGLEANQILIRDGELTVRSSDDGINANGGSSGLRMIESDTTTEEMPNLHITGGKLAINAGGDGLDSNGNILVEGGEIVVDGPADSGNGAIDSGSENGGTCQISGGTVLAIGSSGMAETFDEASAQYSFCHSFSESFEAGEEFRIADSEGTLLYSHSAAKSGNSVVFSCPELAEGETYTLYAGEQSVQIQLDSISTLSGQQGNFHGGPGGRSGMPPENPGEREQRVEKNKE